MNALHARAYASAEPVRPGQLHVAIIGAGATGTELAAELHRTTRAASSPTVSTASIPTKDIRLNLDRGGGDRVLPALPERLSKA